MGVFGGPNVSEDGLVLALDAANYKNSRSSVSTNLISNGSFVNGTGSPNEGDSNPTNTIVQLQNPGETPFVLQQNGNNTEYQLNIDSGMTASTTYVMSGWYAKSSDYDGGDTMFHSRAFSSSGAHNSTGVDAGTLIRSITLGNTTWEYRYGTIVTFDWYLGYGTNNTTGYRYYTNLKFEKGTFPSLLNLIGDSNHGTIENGPTYSSANGGSLVFDGVDDKVVISSSSSFEFGTGNLTVSGWGYVTSHINFRILASTRPGNGGYANAWHIGTDANGTILLYSNAFNLQSASNAVPVNQWFYWTFTRDTGIGKLFVNTIVVASGSVTNNYTLTQIGIGDFPISGAEPWAGRIAQTQIYNRALSAAEIQQNFNATRSRFSI